MAQPPFENEMNEDEQIPWQIGHHAGVGLTPDEKKLNVCGHYYRPWTNLTVSERDLGSGLEFDEDKLRICLDVRYFKPEEISVKTIDGYIIVEAKHEDKRDLHSYISRQFKRRYVLPEDCSPETVNFSRSGHILTIIAPRTVPHVNQYIRQITTILTGPFFK